MKREAWRKWVPALLLAGVMGTSFAQADDQPTYGPGYGMGPGMMGRGYGPGMMYGDQDGYGSGYGMGPGMMGGYGYGMGPGMMGGYGSGMGSGMMGGYGMGHGMMMGIGPVWAMDLKDNQRRAIDNIMREQHAQNWPLMTAMFADYGKLRELYSAENLDAGAIGKVYDDLFKNQRTMIENGIKMRNRIYDQLSKEQKEQLRNYRWGGGWGRRR